MVQRCIGTRDENRCCAIGVPLIRRKNRAPRNFLRRLCTACAHADLEAEHILTKVREVAFAAGERSGAIGLLTTSTLTPTRV